MGELGRLRMMRNLELARAIMLPGRHPRTDSATL